MLSIAHLAIALALFFVVSIPSLYKVTDSWIAQKLVEPGSQPTLLGIAIHSVVFALLLLAASRIYDFMFLPVIYKTVS